MMLLTLPLAFATTVTTPRAGGGLVRDKPVLMAAAPQRSCLVADSASVETAQLESAQLSSRRTQAAGSVRTIAHAAVPVAVAAGVALLLATGAPAHAASAAGEVVSFDEVMGKAFKRALGGGISGAIAGVIQVLTLMWLRTTMNYQYRYGTSTKEAMAALYKQGGVGRFYQGLPFAVFQAPLSRFGDTAANTGILALLSMTGLPVYVRTACASAAGSAWRIAITPIDTLKTTLQVQGKDAYAQVMDKVKKDGITVLYQGALANALASFVGSYPWYLTFNTLNELVPLAPPGMVLIKLLRNAFLGICSACVSDCISNSIRVLKTTRQVSPTTITYREAIQQVIAKDGVKGLFGRGLGTRIFTNALQASLFTVLWKLFEEQFAKGGL